MSDSLEKFITMQVAELGMDKVYSELVALRKRVDATEQRLAELERRGVSVYPASKDKPHNPTCLCKDCHEDKHPAPLPSFQDVEELKIFKTENSDGAPLAYCLDKINNADSVKTEVATTLLAKSRLDQKRIRMLAKEYKAIIKGLGYCSPYWNERVEATLRLAGCDKI